MVVTGKLTVEHLKAIQEGETERFLFPLGPDGAKRLQNAQALAHRTKYRFDWQLRTSADYTNRVLTVEMVRKPKSEE